MASRDSSINKNCCTIILHSCEVCGQEGLREDELRHHMKSVHVEGAVQCPFCDLSSNELTPNEMTLHVNSAHLEYLAPEREFGGGFSEFDDDFDSIWQLEREAKEGLTGGLSDSPTDELKTSQQQQLHSKRSRGADSIDSPMSTCTETSEGTEASQRFGFGGGPREGSSSSVTSSPGPHHPSVASGGAIQKRLRNSVGSNASPSRSSLTLDVKTHRGVAPLESPTNSGVDLCQCPLCNHRDSDPTKLQDHVNRSHFDPCSPSRPDNSEMTSHDETPSLPSCPICNRSSFETVLELERHVNIDHGDILSPEEKQEITASFATSPTQSSSSSSSRSVSGAATSTSRKLPPHQQQQQQQQQPRPSSPDNNGNQISCPVCNRAGFENQNVLIDHIDDHFSTKNVENKSVDENKSPPKKKNGLSKSFKLSNRNSFSLPFSSSSISSSSSSSSRSSVLSSASKNSTDTSSNDQLQNDFLLAQEIARREREKRKYDEQKEFDQLRAQFGMDNDGNYRQQSLTNMQKAVYNGELSVVDYYERQVDLKQSEQSGLDEGHSVSRYLIPRLRSLCQQTGGVSQVYLCSTVDHHAASFGDKGWGCGYRNLQMLLSSLQHNTAYADSLRSVLGGGSQSVPSISKLQIQIEEAWSAGFDVQGRDQLGGRLKNTRKWIGATEIVAFLTAHRVRTELLDFHVPTARDGTHPRLFQWVLNYFKEHNAAKRFAPPLYLQHQGHSRTIVGVEVLSSEAQPRLLIFDPSHTRSHMSALLAGGRNDNATATTLRMLRKTSATIKSKQYQIVAVTGTFGSEHEASAAKIIQSKRIP